jgi:phosphonate transport system substrate-binding protein
MLRRMPPAVSTSSPLLFALPPSLSSPQAGQLERFLVARHGPGTRVVVPESYGALYEGIRSGQLSAGWAPPFLCARLEAQGTPILLWSVRHGVATYRSALVARAGSTLTLQTLAGTSVAWVDPDSTAGYLLACALLKSHGLEPAQLFRAQAFLGTYRRALEAVRDGEADVAAVYCPPARTGRSFAEGLEEMLPGQGRNFSLVSYTEEAPNAGVVASPALSPKQSEALSATFLALKESKEGEGILRDVFSGMEHFSPAPRQGYRSLYRLAVATL